MNSFPRTIPFQNLAATNAPMLHELEEAALQVIRSGWYINGENVRNFEKELAESCGAPYCVAVSNGLDALRLSLRAAVELNLIPADGEVIVPADTYVATCLAISDAGLRPVAAEISPVTYNIDFNKLPLTSRTAAVMPVHLYGTPAWDAGVMRQLADRGIIIIEDNAQAIGGCAAEAGINGSRHTGNLGHAAAWSFYPSKNIGALGDAGAVTTSNPQIADTVRTLANYGSKTRYHNELLGFNCRMDELQAALLRVKLHYLTQESAQRSQRAALYDSLISNPEITKPAILPSPSSQVWHQYVILHPQRDELRKYLSENGVATDVHYPRPPYLQPCYAGSGIFTLDNHGNLVAARHGDFPLTERLAAEAVSLPIANVAENDIEYIATLLNSFSSSSVV